MERGDKIHESVPPPINPGVYPSLQRGGGAEGYPDLFRRVPGGPELSYGPYRLCYD